MRYTIIHVVVICSVIVLTGCTDPETATAPLQEATPTRVPTPAAKDGAPGEGSPIDRPAVEHEQSTPIPEDAQQQLDDNAQVISNVFNRVAPAIVSIFPDRGLGSGFLIDTEGHIVTNHHVIAESDGELRVRFTGLFETIGRVVGTDPDSDIAVVRVDELPDGLEPVTLGDSDAVQVGQPAIAIGNPLGQDRTVTTGIISAIGRTIPDPERVYAIGGAIQTDAAINPGNSGGPLLNVQGEVIGMNTAALSPTGASIGIGFAVPVNVIRRVVPELIEHGEASYPWLGIEIGGEVTTLVAQEQDLPSPGILFRPAPNVPDSPVRQAGLENPAILTAINGEQITSADDVLAYLSLQTEPGDTVTLSIVEVDDGQERELEVQLGARPGIEDRKEEQPLPELP